MEVSVEGVVAGVAEDWDEVLLSLLLPSDAVCGDALAAGVSCEVVLLVVALDPDVELSLDGVDVEDGEAVDEVPPELPVLPDCDWLELLTV